MKKINSRAKGKAGELEFAKYLREHGYENAHRGQQFKGGQDSPDVAGVPGLHFEVKRTESLRLYPALEQATRDAAPTSIPVVAHRPSRQRWVAILSMDDYLLMHRELEMYRVIGARWRDELELGIVT